MQLLTGASLASPPCPITLIPPDIAITRYLMHAESIVQQILKVRQCAIVGVHVQNHRKASRRRHVRAAVFGPQRSWPHTSNICKATQKQHKGYLSTLLCSWIRFQGTERALLMDSCYAL
mgnify:CR=1 FL=1